MSDGQIESSLTDVGESLRRQPSVRDDVMRRVTEAVANPAAAAAASARPSRRRLFGRVAAVAACAAVASVLWGVFAGGNGGGLGAQQAFAAAIANVERARTFSARQIHRWVDEDGREQVTEIDVKFREPDRERLEYVTGLPPEVMVTDYKARQRLLLFPDEMTAVMQDVSMLYAVDDKTGRVKPSELSTGVREDVLKISAQAVNDLGIQKLDGRDVRVLRSADGKEPVKTVWVDPETGQPVQIELSRSSPKSTFTYASIRIDEPLDPALFELDVPPGYKMLQEAEDKRPPAIQEMDGKMLAKARDLVMACYKYQNKKGEFPAELADLENVVMKGAALRALLAAPDDPEGPPVLLYRRPREGKNAGEEIVVYEAPEHRRPGKVVAGFRDGHSEVMTGEYFDKLMK